jgi:hypothetical protein
MQCYIQQYNYIMPGYVALILCNKHACRGQSNPLYVFAFGLLLWTICMYEMAM